MVVVLTRCHGWVRSGDSGVVIVSCIDIVGGEGGVMVVVIVFVELLVMPLVNERGECR